MYGGCPLFGGSAIRGFTVVVLSRKTCTITATVCISVTLGFLDALHGFLNPVDKFIISLGSI